MANAPDTLNTQQSPEDFLMGGSVPSASFLKIGDSVEGTITEPPKLTQQRDIQTGEPKVWGNGDPMMQMVVTLQTEEHDPKLEDDDGRRRLYVKFNLKNAIADAVRKAGAKRLDVGGKLTVTYTHDGKPKTKGFNPPKFYSAEYVAPDANFLDDQRSEDEPQQSRSVAAGEGSYELARLAFDDKVKAHLIDNPDDYKNGDATEVFRNVMRDIFPGRTGKSLTPAEWKHAETEIKKNFDAATRSLIPF